MKRPSSPLPEMEELMPHLIQCWRRLTKTSGPQDVLQTREFRGVVEEVKALLGGAKSGDHLAAYLLYFWPLHYLEAFSILGELPIIPRRVLDVGAGACPLSFAALRRGASEVFATDQNEKALQLGADICGRAGYPISIRHWNIHQKPCPVEGKFDLILLGHCLDECFSSHDFEAFVRSLLKLLSPHGFLVIIDSSQLPTNKKLLTLRDSLVADGVPVQAPCVWKGKCPALQIENTPCFAQRTYDKPYVMKEIQRAANIHLDSLKMSYLIFKSPEAAWPVPLKSPVYRVISPPFEGTHGKHFYLCGTDGKRRLSSNLKEHTKTTRAFKFLRRGELIVAANTMPVPGGFELSIHSELKVEAACGKPLPEKLNE